MMRLSHCRRRMIALSLLAGALVMLPAGTADAKRQVTAECKWFGTAPLCKGKCPSGWTSVKRSKTDGGNPCITGSYVRCCDFQEHCVPDGDSTYDPKATRIYQGHVQCQSCTKWGEDCKQKGGFNTVCRHYVWYNCGEAPRKSTGPGPMGDPIIVPDGKPDPKPDCMPPHIEYDNGVCGCPEGTKGADCEVLIVH